MDFTLSTYVEFIKTLRKQGFCFLAFSDFKSNPSGKAVLLRHDVDRLPLNSLEFARIQADLGIRGAYYFRILPESFDEKIIEVIYSMGHEVGYHYEDFDFSVKMLEGQGSRVRNISEIQLAEIAIDSFSKNLRRMRQIAPVNTVCMHGSPLSKWDSRLLWKYYDYKDFGILGEPYFDIDFSNTSYFTDTGRTWDGAKVSVRDKGLERSDHLTVVSDQRINNSDQRKLSGNHEIGQQVDYYADWKVRPLRGSLLRMTPEGIELQKRYRYRSTADMIRAIEIDAFPERSMMTFHPQRWTNKRVLWIKELVWQNSKNIVKYFLVKF